MNKASCINSTFNHCSCWCKGSVHRFSLLDQHDLMQSFRFSSNFCSLHPGEILSIHGRYSSLNGKYPRKFVYRLYETISAFCSGQKMISCCFEICEIAVTLWPSFHNWMCEDHVLIWKNRMNSISLARDQTKC